MGGVRLGLLPWCESCQWIGGAVLLADPWLWELLLALLPAFWCFPAPLFHWAGFGWKLLRRILGIQTPGWAWNSWGIVGVKHFCGSCLLQKCPHPSCTPRDFPAAWNHVWISLLFLIPCRSWGCAVLIPRGSGAFRSGYFQSSALTDPALVLFFFFGVILLHGYLRKEQKPVDHVVHLGKSKLRMIPLGLDHFSVPCTRNNFIFWRTGVAIQGAAPELDI